jgi:hypothetical protein
MAVLHNGYLYVAHVGDARAYLLLGDQLKRLTRDDTWVQKQVEANVLTPQEAANHELRNVVTQVLGNKEEIEVHLSHPLEVYSDDVFLLCSDGLHDPLNFREIHELLRGKSAQAAAEDLVQASINAQTHDNVTAVVVNVGQIPGKVWPVAAAAPAPAPAGRSGIPLWVFASLTVMVLIFLAILFFFVLPAFNARQDSAEATAVPETIPSTESVPEEMESPALLPAPTEEATAVPLATATVGPTATLEPLPTTTPNPTDTPPPDIVQARGCIILDSFVWQDAQIESNSCDQFAEDTIANGEEVIILENSPVTVNGPDSACDANNFRKVQSVADPSLEGWVLGIYIQPLQPGESCAP